MASRKRRRSTSLIFIVIAAVVCPAIVLAPVLQLPVELEKEVTVLNFPLPIFPDFLKIVLFHQCWWFGCEKESTLSFSKTRYYPLRRNPHFPWNGGQ